MKRVALVVCALSILFAVPSAAAPPTDLERWLKGINKLKMSATASEDELNLGDLLKPKTFCACPSSDSEDPALVGFVFVALQDPPPNHLAATCLVPKFNGDGSLHGDFVTCNNFEFLSK